ncbi:MAG: MBOAT family O-acyltransferase [Bacteroidia bacterium]
MHIDLHKLFESLVYNPKDPLLFNSGFFLFFFFGFLLFYQLVYKRKLTRVILFTLFSLYFFYKACGFYFLLIILSAVVDFNLSNWIHRIGPSAKKKILLGFSIVINLGLLFYFKYTDFFINILNETTGGTIQPLHLILPIGISFYTFENLSYTIDVYRRHFKPVKSFWDYCFFLSFFPKLVMGPIVRASDFIPQIRQDIIITKDDIAKGLYLILGGLFKKAVISDYIYVNYVEYIFNDPARHSGIECLFGVYGYALVIYCDFSGYSDMAIGMAKWMGFRIPANFDSPYQSTSITEFWRRWHISLSSWLRDYLYIPLGGNRKGKFRQYLNLFATMLLGGLWHGASWNFILWGGMHGAALAVDKMRMEVFGQVKKARSALWDKLLKVLGFLITFHFVCFCWIWFKADSFEKARIILNQLFYNFDAAAFQPLISNYKTVFGMMALAFILHALPQKAELFTQKILGGMSVLGRIAVLTLVIWLVMQVGTAERVMPIYLQF